ncbi:hypothetical protein [Kitasatospora sp. NBC_00070]|uniref:hypothetical protein n=1 Tax=Kitasatospora sp. NBC_00070 TaxID=2975962 RepID=UPI0038600B9F
MISTASELNRLFGALLSGRLLPPAEQREMFATRPTPPNTSIPGTTYGLGVTSAELPCGATAWGMGSAISGSWSYTFGTRDGRHLTAQNVNGDWNNPIGFFADVLTAEFCSGPCAGTAS